MIRTASTARAIRIRASPRWFVTPTLTAVAASRCRSSRVHSQVPQSHRTYLIRTETGDPAGPGANESNDGTAGVGLSTNRGGRFGCLDGRPGSTEVRCAPATTSVTWLHVASAALVTHARSPSPRVHYGRARGCAPDDARRSCRGCPHAAGDAIPRRRPDHARHEPAVQERRGGLGDRRVPGGDHVATAARRCLHRRRDTSTGSTPDSSWRQPSTSRPGEPATSLAPSTTCSATTPTTGTRSATRAHTPPTPRTSTPRRSSSGRPT